MPILTGALSISSQTDWLLEDDNPPVRYLTLTHLLGHSPAGRKVTEARSRLMEYSVTRGILENSETIWSGEKPYAKYRGRYWQLIFLGYFRADGSDTRILPGIEKTLSDRGVTFATVHGNDAMLKAAVEAAQGVQILAVTALTSLDEGDMKDLGFKCSVADLVLSRARRALEIGLDHLGRGLRAGEEGLR